MSDTLISLEVLTSPSQIGSTWLQQEKLSTHMSGYPRHAGSRSTWRGQHERVFVRIRTADGLVGVGATRGTATVAVIVEHLAGLLRGRSLAEADPLLPWDAHGYESIKKRVAGWSHAPRLRLGNYAFSALEARQILAEGVVDVIQPDLTWVGGLTAAREIHREASARGVGFSPHYGAMHPWAVQLLATLSRTELAEFVTTSGTGTREDYPDLPIPVHGRQTVPTGVGAAASLGSEIERAARTHTVDLTR